MMARRHQCPFAVSFVLLAAFVSACGSTDDVPCERCAAPITSFGGAGGQAGVAGAAGAGGQAGVAGAAGAGGQAGVAGAAGAGGQQVVDAGAAGAGGQAAVDAGAAGAGGQAGVVVDAGAGGQAGAAGAGGQAAVDSGAAEAAADAGWPPSCNGVVSGAAAKEFVAKGALLIDVRTASEYAAGHVAGAINIPVDDLPSRLGEIDRGRPIVVYCASGTRSGRAAQTLCGAAYRVYDMGPMSKWPV
jgi:rhodanese-related sulfurtransferase